MSRSVAAIDHDAIAHNVGVLTTAAGGAELCAVVKADGYGHGAAAIACTALSAGATRLGVAQVDEALALRASGLDAPIVVLSEPGAGELDDLLRARAQPVLYRSESIDAVGAAAAAIGLPEVEVHLKVDTGMRRVGCAPAEAGGLAARIVEHPNLVLAGTMTHCAVADEPGNPTTDAQLDVFDAVLADLATRGIAPGTRHAANSAATIGMRRAAYDMVRVGIALYGLDPSPAMHGQVALQPAMRWTSEVSFVKQVAPGDAISYGHRFRVTEAATVATVPVGYADGYRRRLGLVGGEVLIGGHRCPIRGVVTMDQFVVECPPPLAETVAVGDEVVLIGSQGSETITADELAARLETINYELTCAVSPRVTRIHRGAPA